MYNALPLWMQAIDGRALLLVLIIAGVWVHYLLAGNKDE